MRAIDCSLTTSMDCPMCTVLGMLPRVPRTNSATSCTVNICNSSSKIAGKEFSRAAWVKMRVSELLLSKLSTNLMDWKSSWMLERNCSSSIPQVAPHCFLDMVLTHKLS